MVSNSTFQAAVREVIDDLFDLLIERQRKYGPKNIEAGGILGCLIRAQDKIERLKKAFPCIETMDISSNDYPDESIEDSMMDLANFGIITLMLYRGTWGKPLVEPKPSSFTANVSTQPILPPRE